MSSLITIAAVPVSFLAHHLVLTAVIVVAEVAVFAVVVWRIRHR